MEYLQSSIVLGTIIWFYTFRKWWKWDWKGDVRSIKIDKRKDDWDE